MYHCAGSPNIPLLDLSVAMDTVMIATQIICIPVKIGLNLSKHEHILAQECHQKH